MAPRSLQPLSIVSPRCKAGTSARVWRGRSDELSLGSRRVLISLWHVVLQGLLWAIIPALPRLALAQDITSGTTVYDTDVPTEWWTGGTISPGATLQFDKGERISGTVINNGTIQANQRGNLIFDGSVSGTGTLSLTGSSPSYPPYVILNGNLGDGWAHIGINYTANVTRGTLMTGYLGSGNLKPMRVGWAETGMSNPIGVLNVNGGTVQSGALYVGYGTGVKGLVNLSSGTVSAEGGVFIGFSSGSGTLAMTGGSLTQSVGPTALQMNNGLLDVQGGSVTVNALAAGQTYNSRSAVTVSGGTIAIAESAVIGSSGTATLAMTGGLMTAKSLSLGDASAGSGANAFKGNGTVTVSGGTIAISQSALIGNVGSGTLTLNGGLVTVGGTLSRTTSSTINLNSGGTLQIGTGGTGGVLLGGTGSLLNNGTLIFNRSDASTYSGILSGSGAVVKIGGGTLTISGSNGYTGFTSINGGLLALGNANALAGGGTLSFGGGTLQYSASNTADYSARLRDSGSAVAIDTNGQNVTFASSVGSSNTGGLIKTGLGTLTLSASNGYTGSTNINGGLLALGSANALAGGGTISFGGGTLQYSASNTADYSSRIQGSGSALAIHTNSRNVTFANVLDSSNTGGLRKLGAGTLTLSASNGYTGPTAVNGGVLALGNAGALAGGGAISFGGGTLQYSASNTADYSGRILGSSSAIAINTNGQNVTFASSLGASNTVGLTKLDLGTLTLSNSNAYTGATIVNGGVLAYGTSNALSDSTPVTVAGGSLDLGSYTDTVASFAITSGSLLGSGKLTAATYALGGGTVAGNLGAGAMTISADSSLDGTADVSSVSLDAGTLTLGSAGRFTSDQVALIGSSGASLSLGGDESVGSLSGAFNIALGSGTLTTGNDNTSTTYSGIVSGDGGLTKAGSGTLILAGDNTFSGPTTISGGALQIGDGGTAGSLAGDVVDNGSLVFNRSDAVAYAGNISGSGSLQTIGDGRLELSGSNSFLGGTSIDGGVLAVGSADALGSVGTISFAGGRLQFTAENTTDYSGRFSTTAAEAFSIDTNGQDVTFATGLASRGGTLEKLGVGTLTLAGNSTYTGLTTISGGTLQVGDGGTGGSVAGNIDNNAVLVFNRSDSVGYAGDISGAGLLRMVGSGTLALEGNNSYSGATEIDGGVLAYGASNVLSDSTAVTVAGGSLNLGSYSDTVASFAITSGSLLGSGKLTAATYALGGGTVAGNLGAGAMTISADSSLDGTADVSSVSLDAGTLTLGSAGRFTSDQVALIGSSGASLSLGGDESVGSLSGAFNIALGSGTLTTGNDNTSTTYSGIASGDGGLTKVGSGLLILAGDNTFSGAATISSGTLQVGNGGTAGSLAGDLVNNGSLVFNRSDAIAYAGNISGSGLLQTIGEGRLELSGSNSFLGGTSIDGGVLAVGSADALGSVGTISFAGGTLQYTGGNATDYSGRFSTAGNQAIVIDTSFQTVTLASGISGAGSTLEKLGSGALVLAGDNTYTGLTTISGGALVIGDGNSTGSLAGDVVNNGSLVFNRGDAYTYAGNISGSGWLQTVGRDRLELSGSNSLLGGTAIDGGGLAVGSADALGSEGAITFHGGVLQFTAANTTDYSARFTGDNEQTFNFDTNGQSVTLATGLSGEDSSLTKFGDGVLSLSGNSSYSGATTVLAGELKVNGSTGPGAMTIYGDAILSGTGTIGGPTTIGGTHMPGNSPGVQTFLSDLAYAQIGVTGPQVFWELAGNTTSNSSPTYDQIYVGGNLDFSAGTGLTLAFGGPGSTVDWTNPFWSHLQQWTFYNVSGMTSGISNLLLAANDWRDSNNVLLSSIRSGYTFQILQIGNDVVIEFVPEPSTYALAVIGLGVAGLRHLKQWRSRRISGRSLAA